MGKQFSEEINYIPHAISWALSQDVSLLTRSLAGASDKNVLAVGSGGSSTAAAFLAAMHEDAFGKVSRWLTPLGLVTRRSQTYCCSAVLISAEGKNKDILAAAESMIAAEMPGIALTLTSSNALIDTCRKTSAATVVSFSMPWQKDGYLATNTLVAIMILIARAYNASNLITVGKIDHNWLTERRRYIERQGIATCVTDNRAIAVLYGSIGRIAAIDVESKMAESALCRCETIDYRQFAHGRHLQLVDTAHCPCYIAYYSKRDITLAESTLALFPKSAPVVRLELPEDPVEAEIIGVIDAILITDILSTQKGVDAGQPVVPVFGRELHAIDIRSMVPEAKNEGIAVSRKFLPGTPDPSTAQAWQVAALDFCDRLKRARFKALACDFDGTFCDTDLRFDGLDLRLVPEIERLAAHGITFGFATGRGDSLYTDLREKIAPEFWRQIIVGYYSGSVISRLDTDEVPNPPVDYRLNLLEQWLEQQGILYQLGTKARINGGQMGLRIQKHGAKNRAVACVRQWIDAQGHRGWRVYCSGHSIDVLTNDIGKSLVVDAIALAAQCSVEHEVLRLGDSGDIDGNDFELLDAGIGLSVLSVSPAKGACWNFLPKGYKGTSGTHFYLSSLQADGDALRFSSNFINLARSAATQR